MNKTADVVVIGGGIIGCSIAAELAGKGAKIHLLERGAIASGASGRNHGLLWYPQDSLKSPLYDVSMQFYRELNGESPLNIALDDQPYGIVIAVASEDQWADAETEAELCAAGGIEVQRLDEAAIRAAEPGLAPGHLGGFLLNDGYRTDPAALTLATALRARERGAVIETHTEVKQLLEKKGLIKGVATDAGIIETPVVVNAAGPWSVRLGHSAGVDIPVTGVRGWLLLTHATKPIANHLIVTAGWHVTDPVAPQINVREYSEGRLPGHEIGLLVQQNRSGHIMLGGTRILSLADEPERSELTHEIAMAAVATIPPVGDVPLLATWSGVRPLSPDGMPIIGWAESIEGLFIATGHGGQGVILGGGTGCLAAQMIRGEETFTDLSPFSPSRF